MVNKYFFLILLFCISNFVAAQNSFCGMSFFEQQNAPLKPAVSAQETLLNKLASAYLSEQGSAVNMGAAVVEIPIVFHIIHQGGVENIPDSVLITEVAKLNQRFSNTGSFNYVDGVNVGMQFCLASVDPYGNPTTGITRTFSSLTNMPLGGDALVKNLSRWNPYRYLNVWLVKDCFTAIGHSAYSHFPWDAFSLEDGIVIQASSIGSGFTYFLLSHEAGHYFGLYHNNEGDSCVNYNCLLDGDRVCDTPPEFEPAYCNGNTCNSDMDDTSGFNPFTVDMNDNSNLMMPIIGCPYLFTEGQADRMNFFLFNTRYQLLSSNGCGQHVPTISLPTAIIGNVTNVCNGYQFVSNSLNAEYLEWDFNNDGIVDNIGDTISYLFPAQGLYTITLKVFNNAGFDIDTFNLNVLSVNSTIFPLSTFSGVSNNSALACLGTNLVLTAVPGMAKYIWSTGDSTQVITIPVTGPVNITLTCIDSAGFIWQRCPAPNYTWGVAASPTPISLSFLTDDTLCTNQTFKVQITPQIGNNVLVYSDGFPFISNNTVNLNYYNQYTNYLVVGLRNQTTYCSTYADTIHILFTTPVNAVQVPIVNGNYISVGDTVANVQWYLGGVPLLGATFNTLFLDSIGCYTYEAWNLDRDCSVLSSVYCNTVVAVEGIEDKAIFAVYPNPSVSAFVIKVARGIVVNNDIYFRDILGQDVPFSAKQLDQHSIEIKPAFVSDGVYFVFVNGSSQRVLIH